MPTAGQTSGPHNAIIMDLLVLMPPAALPMRIIVAIAFILILGSLGSALYFMMNDRGRSNRMVYSLMLRVGLSISLFLFILFAHWMGWIQSTGIPLGR